MYPTAYKLSENIRVQEDATTEEDVSPTFVRGGAGFEQRLRQLLEAADQVRTRAALLAAESQLTGNRVCSREGDARWSCQLWSASRRPLPLTHGGVQMV
jgi:hypothetical protein